MAENPNEGGAALTFAQFVTALEDGSLHSDLTEQLREIAATLSNHSMEHGGSPKASLTLKIGFKLDGGVFEIACQVSKTMPKAPRLRTVMWATPGNNFALNNPRQMQMFAGPRAVGGASDGAVRMVDNDRVANH